MRTVYYKQVYNKCRSWWPFIGFALFTLKTVCSYKAKGKISEKNYFWNHSMDFEVSLKLKLCLIELILVYNRIFVFVWLKEHGKIAVDTCLWWETTECGPNPTICIAYIVFVAFLNIFNPPMNSTFIFHCLCNIQMCVDLQTTFVRMNPCYDHDTDEHILPSILFEYGISKIISNPFSGISNFGFNKWLNME